MSIDLHAKAINILQQIANSVHERDPKNPNLLFFSFIEIQLVERWLKEFIDEVEK